MEWSIFYATFLALTTDIAAARLRYLIDGQIFLA
jgi:hypothetical protein